MENNLVTVRGEKCYGEDGVLDLFDKKITDITEIKGLENITNLRTLYLHENQIKEIKSLDSLTNLRDLDLTWNMIEEVKGLSTLLT